MFSPSLLHSFWVFEKCFVLLQKTISMGNIKLYKGKFDTKMELLDAIRTIEKK